MMELGFPLRALLMDVWSVEIDPDVSLIVTTPLSPEGFSINVLFGTVYSSCRAPWPAMVFPAVKERTAEATGAKASRRMVFKGIFFMMVFVAFLFKGPGRTDTGRPRSRSFS